MWSTVEKHNGHTGHCSGVMSPSLFTMCHIFYICIFNTHPRFSSWFFFYIQIDDDDEFKRIYKMHTSNIVWIH